METGVITGEMEATKDSAKSTAINTEVLDKLTQELKDILRIINE